MYGGDVIADRYRLESRLGEGGMKSVWRAINLVSGREVALAILRQFDPDSFHHEVMLARRVDSPHVARVLDAMVDDGRGIVVSELCRGADLDRHRREHAVPVHEAVRFAHEMTLGLVAIHRCHVLHRDVKPANAILTESGVKLIDFGVALPAVDMNTGVGGLVAPAGTLPFMAPETMDGDVDARTDTYALGVSLFALITGRVPLPDEMPYQLLHRLGRRQPLPLHGLAGYDPRLAPLIARLCTPERAERPYLVDVAAELGALAAVLAREATERSDPPARVPVWEAGELDPVVRAAAASTLRAAPTTYPPPRRIAVRVPGPGRIVLGWPHAPILALTSLRGLTRVVGFTGDGKECWAAVVDDALEGGLVADLDGDGVGELYLWSATRLWSLDAAGRTRLSMPLPIASGPMPWDQGPPTPVVLEDPLGLRHLAVGGVAIDVVTGALTPLAARYQGAGDALIDAVGSAGLSCHGAARQCFRGDVATPAAILARRRTPGFVVAALERRFGDGPTVVLGLWGPGGQRVGSATVGVYKLKTAPFEVMAAAQRAETALFGPEVAPLAVLGDRAEDDVVIVPFLENAPWWGPVLVAFDGTGTERWRERLRPLTAELLAPPMLCVLDGGRPQLLWGGGPILRRDARTGAALPPIDGGVPVAALDLEGRGYVQLVAWRPDAIELHGCGPCLPGAVLWLPDRGDLWRSGTLGSDGLPVGPRG